MTNPHLRTLAVMLCLGFLGWITGKIIGLFILALMTNTGALITAKDLVEVKYGTPLAFTVIGLWLGYGLGKADPKK